MFLSFNLSPHPLMSKLPCLKIMRASPYAPMSHIFLNPFLAFGLVLPYFASAYSSMTSIPFLPCFDQTYYPNFDQHCRGVTQILSQQPYNRGIVRIDHDDDKGSSQACNTLLSTILCLSHNVIFRSYY